MSRIVICDDCKSPIQGRFSWSRGEGGDIRVVHAAPAECAQRPLAPTVITLTVAVSYERGIIPSDYEVICSVTRGLIEDGHTPAEVLVLKHELRADVIDVDLQKETPK